MWVKYLLLIVLCPGVVNAASITTFTNPDSSFSVLSSFLRDADELKIASYTFSNPWIMDELIEQKGKGANITLLLDSGPVGGIPDKGILCELQKNNVTVMLYDGPHRFMHAKYVIKGEEVLVTTENFGTSNNRGFGAVVDDEEIAKQFSVVFDSDLKNAVPFACDLANYSIDYEKSSFAPVFMPSSYYGDAYAFFAPNATDDILKLILSAEDSICIEHFYIYRYWGSKGSYTTNPLLEAVINKAREGLDVKILLDSYWYNLDKDDPTSNYYTAEYVNNIAREENLSMEARLADLEDIGVEKVHAKAMVIDDKIALISSINWNQNSPEHNREAAIVVSGDAARYFSKVFAYDFGERETITITGLSVTSSTVIGMFIVVIVVVAFVLLRKR